MKRKNQSKKLTILLFIILLILGVAFSIKIALFSGNKIGDEQLHSKNFYVYNITDDKVEFKINENEQVPPASLTKMMTVLVA